MKKLFLFCTVLLISVAVSFADFNRMGIPDSAEIRRACAQAWFYGDIKDLREKRPELRKNALGQEFQIRLEETEATFAVIVAPNMKLEVDLYTESGIKATTVDGYPGDAAGAWVLIRNAVTQKPEQIRIFFSADSDVYVQFSPSGNRTLADFVIGGLYAGRGVPI